MELQLEILESKTHRKGDATISFSKKSGLITLSSEATRKMLLEDGAKIAIAKDPNREKDWYVVVFTNKNDPKGIPGRLKDEKQGLCLNCSSFVHSFLGAFGKEDETIIKVPIATVATPILEGRANAYAILTKAIRE